MEEIKENGLSDGERKKGKSCVCELEGKKKKRKQKKRGDI